METNSRNPATCPYGVDVFKFEPEEMTLFAEETHELIVTAYPKGEHEWPPEPEPEPEGEAEAAPAESEEPPADGEAPAEGEPPADGEAAEGEPEPQDGDTEKATAKNVQVSAFPKGPCPFTIHTRIVAMMRQPGKFGFPMSSSASPHGCYVRGRRRGDRHLLRPRYRGRQGRTEVPDQKPRCCRSGSSFPARIARRSLKFQVGG